jgi:hypothetical protein
MTLYDSIASGLAASLEAETLGRCSRWVQKARIMTTPPLDGPFSFLYYPWLLQPHDDDAETVVIQKGAQVGFTEFSINRTLYVLDQLRKNVLYALPNERPDASNFSRGRLNPAVEASPYLENLFASSSESHKITKNKQNLYIRGSRSRSCFKQIDVGLVVLDELDEMTDEAVGLARERLAGQHGFRQLIMLSTPHVEGTGINAQYQETNQYHFVFPCPHCSRHIEFTYPESLVVTADTLTDASISQSYYRCNRCHHALSHDAKPEFLAKGFWVPMFPDRPLHGYHINQMYSSAKAARPENMAQEEVRGRFNVVAKTEFYNSKLGLTYLAEGAQVTDVQINECMKKKEYLNGDLSQAKDLLVTLGIDVGQENHNVWVSGWRFNPNLSRRDITVAAEGQCLYYGTVKNFDAIVELMRQWQPRFTVVDAQPEVKEAVALCKRFEGICYTCYYSLKKVTRDIVLANKSPYSVSVNRTYWLDTSLGKVKQLQMLLPNDFDLEAREHLKALLKTYRRDQEGNPVSEYVKREKQPDHYAHALNYSTIAMGFFAEGGGNHDAS